MHRVKHHVTCVTRAGMVCDDFSRAADHNTTCEAFDPDLTVITGNGQRAVIAAPFGIMLRITLPGSG